MNPEDIEFVERVKRIPLLKAEEERRLVHAMRNGCRAAEAKLMHHNMRLICSTANKFIYSGVPFQDLVQEGCLAYLKVLRKFDFTKGYKVNTYAYTSVKGAIMNFISRYQASYTNNISTEEIDLNTIPSNNNVEGSLNESLNTEMLNKCLSKFLSVTESGIIKRFYGLESEAMSRAEIAMDMSLRAARVPVLKLAAMNKLRSGMSKYMLKEVFSSL